MGPTSLQQGDPIVLNYDTGSAPGVLYNILDLQKITVRNGNLEGFVNTWYMVLRGMDSDIDPKIMEHFFHNAIKDHKDLSEDMAHYRRLGEHSDHPDRSLKFLEQSVNRSIKVAREERNRNALSRSLTGEQSSKALAARPKGKPKAKPKTDTKGGGKGKSDAEKKKTLCA